MGNMTAIGRVPAVMVPRSHRRMQRQVEAYLDGYVDHPGDAPVIEAHLRECWSCSGEAETLRLVKRSLARLAHRRPTDLGAARLRQWAELQLR